MMKKFCILLLMFGVVVMADVSQITKNTGSRTSTQKTQPRRSLRLREVVADIQADMPALFDAEWRNDDIFFTVNAPAGTVKITLTLQLPKTNKNYYFLIRNYQPLSFRCHRKDGELLKIWLERVNEKDVYCVVPKDTAYIEVLCGPMDRKEFCTLSKVLTK